MARDTLHLGMMYGHFVRICVPTAASAAAVANEPHFACTLSARGTAIDNTSRPSYKYRFISRMQLSAAWCDCDCGCGVLCKCVGV